MTENKVEPTCFDSMKLLSPWGWRIDCNMRLSESDEGASRLLGYITTEIVGKPITDLIYDEDKAVFTKKLDENRTEKGEIGKFVCRFNTIIGDLLYLQCSFRPSFDASGELTGWIGASIDVSDIYHNPFRSESTFKAIVDSMDEGIAYIDAKGKIRHINRYISDVIGIPVDGMIGKHYQSFMSPVIAQKAEMLLEQFRTGLTDVLQVEHEMNGRYLQMRFHAVHDQNRYVGTILSINDLTEAKKSEELLRQSNQTLRSILSTLPVGMMIIGKDRRIRQINQTALDIFKVKSEQDLLDTDCLERYCNMAKTDSGAVEKVKTLSFFLDRLPGI